MGTGVCERELFINMIQDEALPLSLRDRAALVLVYTGVKPAASVWMPYWSNNPDYPEEAWLKRIGIVEELAVTANLPYRQLRKQGDEYLSLEIFIGKNIESLEKFMQANDKEGGGSALDYPETAVKAYNLGLRDGLDKFVMQKNELPEDLDDLIPFLFFRPSRLHWQEEMELVRTWAETVKAVAPKLYRDMVG